MPPMSDRVPRVCPECGGDRYLARDAQRNLEAAQRHHLTAEKIARENGLLRYRLTVAQAETHETRSQLQRKIVRQSRAIQSLEAKLRKHGQQPYRDAKLGETAPGAETEAEPLMFMPRSGLEVG